MLGVHEKPKECVTKSLEREILMKCCICNEEIVGKYGHNAEPVVANGRCCDVCNSLKVIPMRLNRRNKEGA